MGPVYRPVKLIIKNRANSQESANQMPPARKALIPLDFQQRAAAMRGAREGCPLPPAMHDGADLTFAFKNKRLNKRLMGDT
jgi:hypothetical protein